MDQKTHVQHAHEFVKASMVSKSSVFTFHLFYFILYSNLEYVK